MVSIPQIPFFLCVSKLILENGFATYIQTLFERGPLPEKLATAWLRILLCCLSLKFGCLFLSLKKGRFQHTSPIRLQISSPHTFAPKHARFLSVNFDPFLGLHIGERIVFE